MALTTTQLQVVKALVAGSTIKDAAHAAGVHRSTVHEWINVHPEFRAALDSARNHFALAAEDDLRSLAEAATSLLRKMIEDESAPPHLRLRAALAVLDRVQSACPPVVRNGETRFEQTMNAAIETAHERHQLNQALAEPTPVAPEPQPPPISRNSPCPCGSGFKYKRCCGTNAPPVLGTRHNPTESDTLDDSRLPPHPRGSAALCGQ